MSNTNLVEYTDEQPSATILSDEEQYEETILQPPSQPQHHHRSGSDDDQFEGLIKAEDFVGLSKEIEKLLDDGPHEALTDHHHQEYKPSPKIEIRPFDEDDRIEVPFSQEIPSPPSYRSDKDLLFENSVDYGMVESSLVSKEEQDQQHQSSSWDSSQHHHSELGEISKISSAELTEKSLTEIIENKLEPISQMLRGSGYAGFMEESDIVQSK